jgi:hypothetical protein
MGHERETRFDRIDRCSAKSCEDWRSKRNAVPPYLHDEYKPEEIAG